MPIAPASVKLLILVERIVEIESVQFVFELFQLVFISKVGHMYPLFSFIERLPIILKISHQTILCTIV